MKKKFDIVKKCVSYLLFKKKIYNKLPFYLSILDLHDDDPVFIKYLCIKISHREIRIM